MTERSRGSRPTAAERVQRALATPAGLLVLGRGPIASLSRRLSAGRLRILGYHGVSDSSRFATHMEEVVAGGTPVGADQVVAALREGAPLPPRPVWVTFDDGDPSVIENGLPVLERMGIPATMFICPGLIESGEPFWWRLSEWANETSHPLGIAHGDLTSHLKTVPDAERRRALRTLIDDHPGPFPPHWRQLGEQDLDRWTAAGMDLGNHSWDHPCLEHCTTDEQREQVRRTHEWIGRRLGEPARLFAYPNGVFCAAVDQLLTELGYDAAVLYDHRLAPADSPPLQISRLLVDADEPAARIRAILSGAEPFAWSLAARIIARVSG